MEQPADAQMAAALDALAQRIDQWTASGEQLVTPVPGLALFRRTEPTEPLTLMYEPSICLVAQGAKRVLLGDVTYVYDRRHFLITSLHLPTLVQVLSASPEQPYLGLRLTLDQGELSRLVVDSNLPPAPVRHSSPGMATGEVTWPLVAALARLVDLLDDEQAVPILAPIIQREIIYRLLVGDQGERLRQMVSAGTPGQQIARAIDWLKDHFTRPLSIDELAAQARMSTSTFHHHFRAMTALSPLQFQKQLRLHEARRLMLVEHGDAGSVAFQVGYESPSQFSREYRRLFGVPPMRDIVRLRQLTATGGAPISMGA